MLKQEPDTVRAPDVAFVSHARLRGLADHPGYLPLAPDVVAEVVSPSDSSSEVEEEALGRLSAGVAVVLVVAPQPKTIRDDRSAEEIRVYAEGNLELGAVISGFRLDVSAIVA